MEGGQERIQIGLCLYPTILIGMRIGERRHNIIIKTKRKESDGSKIILLLNIIFQKQINLRVIFFNDPYLHTRLRFFLISYLNWVDQFKKKKKKVSIVSINYQVV